MSFGNKQNEIFSMEENFQRASAVQGFIQTINRQIGKAYANKNPGETYEQAESWMTYLWFVPTADLELLFDFAVKNRTNPASPLTLQNMLEAVRVLRSQNKLTIARTDQAKPDCVACRGNGWKRIDVTLPPINDEFGEPQIYQMVEPCKCEWELQPRKDSAFLAQIMRLLRFSHTDGIPRLALEEKAAQRLSEQGYTIEDISEFLGNNEMISAIAVVKKIGLWQFRRELEKLNTEKKTVEPKPEVEGWTSAPGLAKIAIELVERGGITTAQEVSDQNKRQSVSRNTQQANRTCFDCGSFIEQCVCGDMPF